MAVAPCELSLPQIVDVADKLAVKASEAGIEPSRILLKLNISDARLNLNGAPRDVWLRIVRAVHAGQSAKAGYRSDAVARLIETVTVELPGNSELSNLAYQIGHGYQVQSGSPNIFLSYSHSDRSDVDRLHDALRTAKPGVAVFQDHRSLRPGQDWLDILREEAGRATVLACWVTPDYVKSAFCNYEIGVADSQGATIVPVFIGAQIGRQVPAYLSRRQAITCDNQPDIDDLAARLIAVLP